MKKTITLIIILALTAALWACGGEGVKLGSANPYLAGTWNATKVIATHVETDVREHFARGATLELQANGRGELTMDGSSQSAKWSFRGGVFRIIDVGVGELASGQLRLEISETGIILVFEREGGYTGPEETPIPTAVPESWAFAWWAGQWRGSWSVVQATGAYAESAGKSWDCYADIDARKNGTATVRLWDDETELGKVELEIDAKGGVGPMGAAASLSGNAFFAPVAAGTWTITPEGDGTLEEDGIVIESRVEGEGGDSLSYRIVLSRYIP